MPSKLTLYNNLNLPSAAPRVYKVDIDRFKVKGYDVDNGYPQRMQSLINASPTAKMATQLYADFIFGQGFDKDDVIWNMELNSKGQTGDDLLSLAAKDWSEFEKCYFQINYNALFNGVEINYVPFENARYGIDEFEGTIALYDNWWNRDRFGRLNISKDMPDRVDIFNPDAAAIKAQVAKAGGWKSYKGQIFAWSKNFQMYPLCVLDTATDALQAEILSFQTTKSNIKNNFGDKVIWKEKGKFASDLERQEFTENVQKFIGPDGDQVIVCEVETDEQAPDIIPIESKMDDKKFAYTDEKIRATIYRMLGQSAILHSDLNQGKYNQNQLPESIKAYNNRTERARISMQRAFKKMLSVMGINSECAITPLNDLSSAMQNAEGANNGDANQQDENGNQNQNN